MGRSDTGAAWPPSSGVSTGSRNWAHVALLSLLFGLLVWTPPTFRWTDTLADGADWLVWQLTALPKDPAARAEALLARYPLIDGHIDLPILARAYFTNQVDEIDLDGPVVGHVDIPRLRKGGVGGFFWSAYIMCPEDAGWPIDNDGNFTTPTHRVRDTLEQIDVARIMIDQYPDTFELVSSSKEWRRAMKKGKIAGMIGIEGGHQIGSTLAALRTYYALGARYVTLTHTCNNALADSCGMQGTPIKARWGGISDFGKAAVKEMNRLGMLIDVSHTSPATASDALTYSLSPPIFSHSNARGVHAAVRNVPDSILVRIGATAALRQPFSLADGGEGGLGWGNDTGEAEKDVPSGDALIMLNFSPPFISEWADGSGVRANVSLLADHADYIGKLAGRDHIGIGSDYDGIGTVPVGLEDASTYPHLIAELISRGWSDAEVAGLTSENFLRILSKAEAVAATLKGTAPTTTIFEGRSDLRRRHF